MPSLPFPIRRVGRNALPAALALCAASSAAPPASAHPHVFILARTEVLFDQSGNVTGVRHHWQFDESYSAFAVQGLDSKKNGTYTREDLAGLAKVNVESLAEYSYFSFGKAQGKPLTFTQPKDYFLDYSDQKLTLTFSLPLEAPISGRTVTLQVYDPSYFVSFNFADQNAVTLDGAKPGCSVAIKKPVSFGGGSKTLSEDFFNQLGAGSDYGAGLADRAVIACP